MTFLYSWDRPETGWPFLPVRLPGCQQARIAGPLGFVDQFADALVEHVLVHPAARKRIQGQDVAHDAELVEVLLPACLLGLFLPGTAAALGWVLAWLARYVLGVVRLLPIGYSNSSSGGIVAAVAALFFAGIFVMLALSQAHDGTEGLTDELD